MKIDRPILIRCRSCGTLNRLPPGRLSSGPRCGSCRAPLSVHRAPLNLDGNSLDRTVSSWPEYILLEFWSRQCGHCQRVEPAVQEAAADYPGLLLVGKVEVNEEPALAGRFGVKGAPTFILLKKGRQLARLDGAPQENSQLDAWLRQYMK